MGFSEALGSSPDLSRAPRSSPREALRRLSGSSPERFGSSPELSSRAPWNLSEAFWSSLGLNRTSPELSKCP
eukprot:9629273-Alexandrium_andersonii.AAC.1